MSMSCDFEVYYLFYLFLWESIDLPGLLIWIRGGQFESCGRLLPSLSLSVCIFSFGFYVYPARMLLHDFQLMHQSSHRIDIRLNAPFINTSDNKFSFKKEKNNVDSLSTYGITLTDLFCAASLCGTMPLTSLLFLFSRLSSTL